MKHINKLVAFAVLIFSAQAQALLITANSTTSVIPTCPAGDTACETAAASNDSNTINTYLESVFGTRLYKSDFGGTEDGAFAGSYDTVFNELDSDGDPNGAVITYNAGSDSIACPSCYLLVKDGSNNPAWYLYDLDALVIAAAWDGMETITLSGFWSGAGLKGAISNVAIYGPASNVPEPGILALLGLGLVGMAVTRRKVK